MFTWIRDGEILAPESRGRGSVLLAGERIAALGDCDPRALEVSGLVFSTLDARGAYVVPGFIDPHQHLIGGSGERGFRTQTPEIHLGEIVTAGITTVVGCIGVDTSTRTLPALLGKVKGLNEEGLSAYLWSAGYDVPPRTLTGSIRTDIMYIGEVIGAGEIAIADRRSTAPSTAELARLVSDAYVGGILSGKRGLVHFHVGEGKERLGKLRELMSEHEIQAESLYPTHVERNEPLMREAIDLTRQGVTVDVDVMEEDLATWAPFYLKNGGHPSRITVSSDCAICSPRTLHEQFAHCAREKRVGLEQLLPMFTANTAAALGLRQKGRLAAGTDADVLVLEKESFEVRHVVARGKTMVKDGKLIVKEAFLEKSNRSISLQGQKHQARQA